MDLVRRNLGLVFLLLLVSGRVFAQANVVPPPKTEAQMRDMMKITYNQHILPEGANPLMLEHLMEIGEVVIYYDRPQGVKWMSAAGIMINAPVDQVFAVVGDFTHYKDYVPFSQAAEVQKVANNFERVDFHLRVAMFFLHYSVDYGVYHLHRPPYRTDWCYAWGDFGLNVGFWELIPTADGKRTMAFYSVYSEPRSSLIKAIYDRDPQLELMTNVSTAVMVTRAVKGEAEKRSASAGQKALAMPRTKKIFEVLNEDPDTMKKFLDRGNLLVLEDGPTVYVTAGALVNATREQSWNTVTDFPSYTQFAPGTKKVEYLGKGDKGPKYRVEVSTNLLFLEYSYQYEPEYVLTPPELLTYVNSSQTGNPTRGFTKLVEFGSKTLLFSGSTADIRAMSRVLNYALTKEPTLEHAIEGSQALVNTNSLKKEIEKRAAGKTPDKK